jgi:hypothetical protein
MNSATIPLPICSESSETGSVATRDTAASPPSTVTQAAEALRPGACGLFTMATL